MGRLVTGGDLWRGKRGVHWSLVTVLVVLVWIQMVLVWYQTVLLWYQTVLLWFQMVPV